MKQALQRITYSLASVGMLCTSLISTAFAEGETDDTAEGGGGSGIFGDDGVSGLPAGGSEESIRNAIIGAVEVVLNFLALIAVVVVIIAGIRLIISQGEDDAKDKAKKTIFYALIGLVIVLLARVIVGLVTNVLASKVGGGE